MPQYRRLPNGQVLELPDNLTQEQIEIVNERYFTAPQRGIESLSPEEDQDTSILGQIVETGKAVPRGFTSSLISSGEGIVSLFDKGNDSETLKKIRNARKYVNEESFLAADDAYKDKFLTKFGEGLGSFATFATPGVALKVAGAAGKTIGTGSKIAATATGFGLAGTAGVSQQADQMETSKAKGVDISTGKEITAELAGLGIGFTEMLPIFGLLSRIPGGQVASDIAEKHMGKLLNKARTKGGKVGKEVVKDVAEKGVASSIKRASKTAGEEAVQEAVAGMLQDSTGKLIYDRNIGIGNSAWDDLTVGGAVGFASDLLVNAIIPGKQKNKVSALNNEQKHEEETERINKFNNADATQLEYEVVEVGGKTVNEPVGYQVVEKNSGVVVSDRFKKPKDAINQKTILDNQKNEASLLLTTESNANDQGRSGDAQGKVAIIQANSDNANKVSRSEAQTIIVPEGATDKNSINDQWQSHINKKVKGKSKKAQNKRQKYIYGNNFTPAELLADKIITKKQYNETMQNKIDAMNIKKPSASTSDLNKTLKSKNIDEKIGSGSTGSTNFHSYLKALTGKDRWTKLNDTEKKYVNARIKQLPKANKKRKMIDTTASKYSLENINTVIETQDNNYNETGENKAYTVEEIQTIASTPNKIDKDATNQMVERLVDSGRLTKINSGKDKGKYKFFKDRGKANAVENETQFQKQNLMDSEAFFETQAEFKARLSTKKDKDGNALLTPTEINQIAKSNSQKKIQDLGLGDILADEEFLDFDGVVQDKEGRYQETTIRKSTTDGLSKRERLSRAGLSAEEGSTVRKEKNKARLKSLIEKELKKKGLDKLGISAAVGKLFAKKSKTGFFDVSAGAGVYIPSLGQVVLNYETFLDVLPQNLDSLSDKEILSRQLILKDKKNKTALDTTIGGTINHESIHALKDLNLFTQKEWVVLSNYVQNTKDPRYKGQTVEFENNKGRKIIIEDPTYLEVQLEKNAGLLDADGMIEEAIAEAFGVYTRNPNKFSGMPRNLFQRILDTLTSFFTAFDSSGLTANEIFSSIQEGDLTSSERLSDATMDTRPTELTQEEEIKYQRFTPAERQFIERVVTLNDLAEGAENGAVRMDSMDALIDTIQEQADRPRVRMTILPRKVQEIVSSVSGYIRFNTDNSIRKRRQNRFGDEVKYQRINAETQPLLDVGLPYSEIGYQLDEWFKANGSEAENASIVKVNNLLKKTPTRETLKLDKTYLNDKGKEKTAFKNFAELKQSVQEILDEGNFDPNWYLKVGQEAEAIVGKDNMVEFSVLWAITSASTDPELNFQNALEVMSLARGIDPKTGNKKHKDVYLDPKGFKRRVKALKMPTGSAYTIDEISNFYEDANWTTKTDTSIKTPIYGLTTLMVKDGEYMPFMVADRWMYRTMGFTNAISKKAPKRSEIHYAQYMVKKLANEQYTYNNGKNTRSLRPDEIQAALWFSIRNNSGNDQKTPGTVPSILEKSKKTIDAISFAKEKNYWSDVGSFINKEKLDLNPYERITYVGAGKFGTLQMPRMKKQEQERASKLFIEINPGETRGYGKLTDESGNSVELTYEQVDRLTEEVMDSITDENGKINFLKKLGIPHQVTKTHGAYDGGVSPSYVIDILGQRVGSTLLSDIGRTLGDALMQDAVVTTQTNPDGKRPASLLSKKANEGQESAFTNEEITLINDAINSEGGISNYYDPSKRLPLGFTAKYINDSILIIDEQYNNVKEDSEGNITEDFSQESENTRVQRFEEFQRYIQERLSNIDGLPEIEYSTAYTDGEYISDYTEATSGIGIQADTEGSSNIQNTAVSDLYIPAWRSFTKFIQNEGLTTENNVAPYENAKTTALTKAISPNEIKYQRARSILQEANDNIPATSIPRFNLKTTSPLAQTTVLEYIENEDKVGIDLFEDTIKFQRLKNPETNKPTVKRDEPKSFGEMAIEQLSGLGKNFRFNYLDKLEAIERSSAKYADKEGRALLASSSAIGAARLGERVKGIIQETLTLGGVPYYDSASVFEGGTQRINKTFVDRNGKTQEVNLLLAIANNVDAEGNSLEDDFQEYAIYRRMKALTSNERKNSEFAKTLKKGNNNLYKDIVNNKQNRFEKMEREQPQIVDMWEQWQAYNDSVLEFARDAGILSDELAEYYRQTSDYIPFYKSHEDLDSGTSDLFGEDQFGESKGKRGVKKINDKVLTRQLDQSFNPKELVPAYEAMLGNTLAIMQISSKNITRQRLAREQRELKTGEDIESSEIGKNDDFAPTFIFTYKENGQEKYMRVDDPLLVGALESFNTSGGMSMLLNIVGVPSTVLRELVTRDPGFMVANLLRDTVSAYATSGANFVPVIDSIRGAFQDIDNINRFGIVSGYDLSKDELNLNKFINKELRRQGLANNNGMNLKNFFVEGPKGVWDFLGAATTRSDAATRQAVFKKVFEATGDQYEAAYQALEVINFNRRGANPIVRVITTAIPFLNARMQGLDVLYRAGLSDLTLRRTGKQGDRRYGALQSQVGDDEFKKKLFNTFLSRLLLLTGLSALYWMYVSDDEDYMNTPDHIRDNNFLFKLTKNFSFKLPIAFEIGVLTKVIPERLLELAFGNDTTRDTWESAKRNISQTFRVDPFNFQVIAPIYEAMNNKNKFTGQPIESYFTEKLEPGARSKDYTNELIRILGETFNFSPAKAEHIVKGYFGTLGGYVLTLTDTATRSITGTPQTPFRPGSVPFGRFAQDDRQRRGLQSKYYDLQIEVDRVVSTLNNLRKKGRYEKAEAYSHTKQSILDIKEEMNFIRSYMENYRNQRNNILRDETMSSDLRKKYLNDLEWERDQVLMVIPLLKERANLPTSDLFGF